VSKNIEKLAYPDLDLRFIRYVQTSMSYSRYLLHLLVAYEKFFNMMVASITSHLMKQMQSAINSVNQLVIVHWSSTTSHRSSSSCFGWSKWTYQVQAGRRPSWCRQLCQMLLTFYVSDPTLRRVGISTLIRCCRLSSNVVSTLSVIGFSGHCFQAVEHCWRTLWLYHWLLFCETP